ncbi:hypothetical protein Q4E40_13775 [Pontibacter sp. BT731]|uniref:hypothetical protein n=1 Tax=Pontibacter coccineus TaxID=3063328 RepID=UPI0026E1F61A|nr:hypothetical protein [Pontibacter sp. BT731]MDO6391203.1 hypothetical protein [Pontibacter sp. BT731]
MSEVFLFVLMEEESQVASRTSAEATVLYMLIMMPVLYGVCFGLHMLFLLFTHAKKQYIFLFNPVIAAFFFDLLILAFIGLALDQDRALTKTVLAITAGTSLFLLIEIYRSFYRRSRAESEVILMNE